MKHAPAISIIVLSGCSWFPHGERHPPPIPPEIPIAIEGINSSYDDFNSAALHRVYGESIVFSTNRGSAGKHYDLYEASIVWDGPNTASFRTLRTRTIVPFETALMSEANERGPILVRADEAPIGSRPRFVFTSDRAGGEGGFDLYATEEWSDDRAFRPLVALNTAGDDMYLTPSPLARQMLLASNAAPGAPSDIYAVSWREKDTIDNLPDRREIVEALSSSADDTAPFVYFLDKDRREGEVIFVSSRPGGLGEHDLYCSRFTDPRSEADRADEEQRAKIRGTTDDARRWSKPVLLRALSSPRDEYRPIVFETRGARYLVFSSTREGGQGGYDLYVVGYTGCPRV